MNDKPTIIPKKVTDDVIQMKALLDAGYQVMYMPVRRAGITLRYRLLNETEDIPHEEQKNLPPGSGTDPHG